MTHTLRQRSALLLAALGLLVAFGLLGSASASAKPLNLETLTAAEAEKMLEKGQITSVELAKDYTRGSPR